MARSWWPAATLGVASAAGGTLLAFEALIGLRVISTTSFFITLLIAHILAFAILLIIVYVSQSWRPPVRQTNRSNPFWQGVWYGLLVAIAVPITFAILITTTQGGLIPAIGAAFALSAWTVEFPFICLAGGLAWGVLSRKG